MELISERQGGTLALKVSGRVDSTNASDFEKALTGSVQDGDQIVVLDFESLAYISSAGLRALLLMAKFLKNKSMKFAIYGMPAPIREIFDISGFDRIIPVHSTQDDAVAALSN